MSEFKNLKTSELVEIAYRENNDDRYWAVIQEIHSRGSDIEFQTSLQLINSDDPVNKQIGAQILSQLKGGKDTYHNQAVDALIPLLYDKNDDVIEVAAFSLGHRPDIKSVPHLLKLLNHSSNGVRHGVAFGLSYIEDENAANGLIQLTKDSDFDTRNWATFGLAQCCEIDSPAIRNALKDNLQDKNPEIRGEALIGLAVRKDSCTTDMILRELAGEFHGTWAVKASEILADPHFIQGLQKIKEEQNGKIPNHMMSCLDDAIKACLTAKNDML